MQGGVAVTAEVRRDAGPASFDAFVRTRGQALWRTAWLLTGDDHLAEDLVQTALQKSWRHWERVGAAGFEAYVRQVMLNTWSAWWRRKWRGEVPSEVQDRPSVEGPDRFSRDVLNALATLPRGQRAVVVLRYFDDLTEKQTALALGISIGTVKSQTSRALAALRTSPLLQEGTDD